MRTKDKIVGRQIVGLAHRRGFLADGEMGGTAVVVLDPFVDAFLLDAVQHGFKLADDDHVVEDALQVVGAILGDLGRRVGDVGVDGNLRRGQRLWLTNFGRVNGDKFGHDFGSFLMC